MDKDAEPEWNERAFGKVGSTWVPLCFGMCLQSGNRDPAGALGRGQVSQPWDAPALLKSGAGTRSRSRGRKDLVSSALVWMDTGGIQQLSLPPSLPVPVAGTGGS